MSLPVKQVELDDTAIFKKEFRDESNVLVDPTTVQAKVFKQDGTLVTTLSTVQDGAVGKWKAYFDISSTQEIARYYIEWKGVLAGLDAFDREYFDIVRVAG